MIILQVDKEELTKLIESALKKVISELHSTNITQSEPEILLTVQEAAKFLRLSVPTIYTLISKREIPVMKRSKRCYFLKSELIDYLKAGRNKTKREIKNKADEYLKGRYK